MANIRRTSRKKPAPDDVNLHKYDQEPYMRNQLLNFHILEVRERRHYSFLKKSAAMVCVYCITKLRKENFALKFKSVFIKYIPIAENKLMQTTRTRTGH